MIGSIVEVICLDFNGNRATRLCRTFFPNFIEVFVWSEKKLQGITVRKLKMRDFQKKIQVNWRKLKFIEENSSPLKKTQEKFLKIVIWRQNCNSYVLYSCPLYVPHELSWMVAIDEPQMTKNIEHFDRVSVISTFSTRFTSAVNTRPLQLIKTKQNLRLCELGISHVNCHSNGIPFSSSLPLAVAIGTSSNVLENIRWLLFHTKNFIFIYRHILTFSIHSKQNDNTN